MNSNRAKLQFESRASNYALVMERFKVISKIGEGAHGVVLKAQFIVTGEMVYAFPNYQVALKKIPCGRLESGGVPTSILREIKALEQIDHQNIIKLREVVYSGNCIVLVCDYMLSDLAEILRNATRPLTEAQLKAYMKMILCSIRPCRS